jgi:SecD/SecF fusion protein
LGGDAVVDARQDYDQNGRVEITMLMNNEGAKIWKRLTADNIGNQIAIVLDDYVYSAPELMVKFLTEVHQSQETSQLKKPRT